MGSKFRLTFQVLGYLPKFIYYCHKFLNREARHPEKYPLKLRSEHLRMVALDIYKHLPVEVRFEGLEKLKVLGDRPVLAICNHQAATDIIPIAIAMGRPFSFVSKKENSKNFLMNKFLKCSSSMLLDRSDPFQGYELMMKGAKRIANEGNSFIIFPEGTRNKKFATSHVAEFKPGALKMAYKAKCPIVVFSLYGTHYAVDAKNHRRVLIQFRVVEVKEYEDFASINTIEHAQILHDLVDKNVEELKENDRQFYASGLDKQKKTKWWKEL